MKKILIMGLPGAGKTTLASRLVPLINAKWLNADEVRKKANDWDFSDEGRKRQAKRMADLAEKYKKEGHYVVADFICPTPKARELFNPDFVIWVDTIKKGRFEDTNKMFVKPKKYNVRVTTQNSEIWSFKIANQIQSYEREVKSLRHKR
jgi:adenylylsulfate kinase